jgi:hypothetical protein
MQWYPRCVVDAYRVDVEPIIRRELLCPYDPTRALLVGVEESLNVPFK